jgi:uncharacterized RDD family membrane protein YckC
VEASAAQNAPVTKTCSQCGAVLPSSLRGCHFCDSSFIAESYSCETASVPRTQGNLALTADVEFGRAVANQSMERDPAWRRELAQRLKAYRVRRRRLAPNSAQSPLPFEEPAEESTARGSTAAAEPGAPVGEDFSFTIAVGRPSKKRILENSRMVIDVSSPLQVEPAPPNSQVREEHLPEPELHLVAPIEDRRWAALIDASCLLFAYGGFLALFGSLGGEFTLSKLSAAVYAATLAIVYLQYFALFTIFGGTTPGMILRGLQVVSFLKEPPTPRQMLLRSAGYLLSAGTFFLGFLWAMWDEDGLTWHDRLSRTYLSTAQTFAEIETSSAAHTR